MNSINLVKTLSRNIFVNRNNYIINKSKEIYLLQKNYKIKQKKI